MVDRFEVGELLIDISCTALTFCLYASGGKGGAVTIDSDREYMVAVDALLKKNHTTCQVGVEFDIDGMEGFRITRKRVQLLLVTIFDKSDIL